MNTIFTRAFTDTSSIRTAEPGTPIPFTASTSDIARDGMIIEADGWILDNFLRNPVILWAHDYTGSRPPIGRAVDGTVVVKDGKLFMDVQFDQNDDFARTVEHKIRNGYINAMSVGWDTKEFAPPEGKMGAPRVTRAELLEASIVPVPSDPGALAARQKRALVDDALKLLEDVGEEIDYSKVRKAYLPPHTTEKAPEDAAWDAASVVRELTTADQLRLVHAWADPGKEPDTRDAYQFPHHNADGSVVWSGVALCMSRLFQPGIALPEDDRRGVYNHLARHYKQFGKEAPEFRSAEELFAYDGEQVRGLFYEGEAEMFPAVFGWGDERAGKAISTRNRELLERVAGSLEQAAVDIRTVLATAGTPKNTPEFTTDDEAAAAALQEVAKMLATLGEK